MALHYWSHCTSKIKLYISKVLLVSTPRLGILNNPVSVVCHLRVDTRVTWQSAPIPIGDDASQGLVANQTATTVALTSILANLLKK